MKMENRVCNVIDMLYDTRGERKKFHFAHKRDFQVPRLCRYSSFIGFLGRDKNRKYNSFFYESMIIRL